LFDTPEYTYRVFVTNMKRAVDLLVWFYDQRAGAENLIKEANHDAGLTAYPSGRWLMNCNRFQLVMLAYNLNCWLMLFHREEDAQVATLKHITLATARLRFLFPAARIWRHAGRVGVSYSDHYPEQGIFRRLMDRLGAITSEGQLYRPVLATALREWEMCIEFLCTRNLNKSDEIGGSIGRTVERRATISPEASSTRDQNKRCRPQPERSRVNIQVAGMGQTRRLSR
jgi:hypothetical protein